MRTATIMKLARAFKMTYCHPDYCTCGDDNLLLWLETAWFEEHDLLPSWANGCEPADLYAWVQQEAWKSPVIVQVLYEQGVTIPHPVNGKGLHL